MLVDPEDRASQDAGSLLDRLRAAGIDWPPSLVDEARRALSRLLGDDAAADGRATAALVAIATGRDLSNPTGPPGCLDCRDGWVGEDLDGRPFPCPTCRPKAAARVAARDHGAP